MPTQGGKKGRKHGNKRTSPSFQRYWAERRIVINKLRRWRKSNPKATDGEARKFEATLRDKYKDTRK